jgi:hypothetical protein
MRKFALALLLLVSAVTQSAAAGTPFAVDGEVFTKKSVAAPPSGEKLIEYVREIESFESWTKLIGLRYQHVPGVQNDPKQVAAGLAQLVKSRDPTSQSRIIANEKTNEVLIDFLTRDPGGQFMEFNVFRYAKSSDGNAVISLQFAYRFTDVSAEGTQRFIALRESWIRQAVAVDMRNVVSALEQLKE